MLTDLVVSGVRHINSIYLDDLVSNYQLPVLLSRSLLGDLGDEQTVGPLLVGCGPQATSYGEAEAGVVPQESCVDLLNLDDQVLALLTRDLRSEDVN